MLSTLMGLQVNEKSILDELEVGPEEAIRDFYNTLSTEEQAKLHSPMGVVWTVDDIVESYKRHETDVDSFIEHMRKCYLK